MKFLYFFKLYSTQVTILTIDERGPPWMTDQSKEISLQIKQIY